MSWQAASLAILLVVLAGGFGWYERGRPPSRVVALVAALAALAIAGRLALAPVPNVLATTDIVLFTGYALGAGPGFVVGALAALVSNFWLGQGPWTPWQMAGWGLVGIGGAAVAAATARRLGRAGLAVACGVAGLAYGALLDLSVMVTYGGEQSLDRYLALAARGLPFNLAHAAGNVVLALVAGPAMVRMLLRYRRRCEFRWREAGEPAVATTTPKGAAPGGPGAAAAGVAAALALAAGAVLPSLDALTPARAAQGEPEASASSAAAKARAWLERARNRDGGYGPAPRARSSPEMTGWAILGLEAAGRNPLDLAGRTPVHYLRAERRSVRSTGDLERTILALVGAGLDPRDFGGRDLVAALRSRRAGNGSFQGQVNLTAFAIFALRAVGLRGGELRRPARWLRRAQNGDGGWGYRSDQPSEPDSTGAALQGLAAAGSAGTAGRTGARYLRRAQRRDGGWALAEGGPTNSQSTAWALQGLLAVGANPAAVRTRGRSGFDYLAARQASDGHYRYSASSDQTPVWVTAQALVAVSREVFPLRPVPRSGGGGGSSGERRAGGDGSSSGSGAGHEERKRERERAERPGRGNASEKRADGGSAPPREAFEQAAEEGEGSVTRVFVLGGLGGLALALAGGFVIYRRRISG